MDSIFVLFIAEDIEFAKALVKSSGELDKSIVFQVFRNDFEDVDWSYEDYKKNFEHADIVVSEGSLARGIMEYPELNMIVDLFLADKCESNHNIEFQGEEKYIYKFASVEEILRKINLIYNSKYGRRKTQFANNSCQYVYFCSSCGGTGKTTISLGLAQELTRYHGKSVLYINFEEFDSSYRYLPTVEGPTLESFMIDGIKNKDINSYLYEDLYGVKYFNLGQNKNPLKCLSSEELLDFIDEICKSSEFQYIFIDGTINLDESEVMLIKTCNFICQIEVKNCEKCGFTKYIKKIIEGSKNNELLRIINFSQDEEWNKCDEINYIDYDNNIFLQKLDINMNENGVINPDNYCKINIDGDFGVGVKELSLLLTLN